MKKILLIVSLCFLLAPIFVSASIGNNLYYGLQKNSDVKQLQEFLIDKGFLTSSATGNFFSLTLKAVKAYQANAGISSTGYVGIFTRTAINNELTANLSASNQESTSETGTIPPTPTPIATTNDIITSLQAQIKALQDQLALMQQQNATVQQLQQTVQQQNQTIQQIQQNTQQIAQNTTPLVVVVPKIRGCMDSSAVNYNPNAQENDTCIYSNLTLSNINYEVGSPTWHVFKATGEDFKMQSIVIKLLKSWNEIGGGRGSLSVCSYNSGIPCSDWGGGGISYCDGSGAYYRTIPSACANDPNYRFANADDTLIIPQGKDFLFGINIDFEIISAIFKGQITGKIITLP